MASPVKAISFTINGQKVSLSDPSPQTSLNEWIRSQYGLTGTKRMCGEGGCGCCVVSLTRTDLLSNKPVTLAINSCLCPLYSVNGCSITTVEGIGSSKKGFHPVQKKIAELNGTQCGYCTPGMVMSMYSLLQETPKPTKQLVEDSFDGNICRCTGYRSILDSMKSFAVDSDEPQVVDIEDVCPVKCSSCPVMKDSNNWLTQPRTESDPTWYQPTKLSEAFDIYQANTSTNVKFVSGNTGKGVFKETATIGTYIELSSVQELYNVDIEDTYISVGACITINVLIDILKNNEEKSSSYKPLAEHLQKIANVPVRNVGTWAGNLMLTHDNDNFPSDVFTIMEAAGATVTIAHVGGTGEYPLWDFLNLDMSKKIIVSLQIPYCSSNTVFSTFKIMPRSQNAHAYVNAAFSLVVDPDSKTVKSIPSFVFGGINEHAISAPLTESFMIGKSLKDPDTLKGAMESLSNEIKPNAPPVSASPSYRKNLALSLFYKFYLQALGISNVNPLYQSAAIPYVRPVSQGSQSYSTDSSKYPVNQPLPKLTATLQASGEAEYTTDIPHRPGELAGAFVLTTQGNAKILSMDTTAAMAMEGAVAIVSAKDIPQNGKNDFMLGLAGDPEIVFATDVSEYAGQAVALALADTQEHALKMAKAVTLTYQSQGKQILTIQDAIDAKSFYDKQPDVKIGDADGAIKRSDHVVNGEVSCGTQYHFTMETQTSFVIPEDDGYTVYSSNQWAQLGQFAVAGILGIPNNKVSVIIKRVGGAYGGKISRASHTAAACALGAYVTQRPVRLHLDLETNMKMVGKRFPYYAKYTVGCNNDGTLNGVKIDIYNNSGCSNNDNSMDFYTVHSIDNTYNCKNWSLGTTACKTNIASNTATRAPGYLPAIFIMESLMDDVARNIGMDVEQFKQANLYKKGDVSYVSYPPKGQVLPYCNIGELWQQISTSADVQNRKSQISDYNKANRWRKRGLSMVPLRYGINWNGANYTILVSVYTGDGSVSVVHGGVEIGQGVNTKVAQVTASTLGVPLSSVTVVPTNSFTNPNGITTGGSVASELNCLGALNACKSLKARLDNVKEGLKASGVSDPDWLQVVQKAFASGVDLSEKYYVYGTNDYYNAYNPYGVTVSEVEVDVLTGETEILRVDILYDCGQSINPEIDIGQVEGAFVMGLGYFLTERVVFDTDTGVLLTHNTWEYKPPTTKDIPIDFRIELLKDAPNPLGILGSKAVGEPPLCMSSSVLYAMKRAIESARHDAGNDTPFTLSAPATVEDTQQACLVDPTKFTF